MKYLSKWQPLVEEDRYTALLFGFMRHAPREAVLTPWLSEVLGRPIEPDGLSQASFWPKFPSLDEGASWIEPDLAFAARDPEPLLVIVEVKPGFGGFTRNQIAREVVDGVASSSVERVAAVLVSASLSCPPEVVLLEWQEHVRNELVRELPQRSVAVELKYASFASIGRAIEACGSQRAEWSPYAEDVLAQLRRRGLLDYEGAPMLDDLEGLTIPNAVEAFNRAMLAARSFYLQLHAQAQFEALGLTAYSDQGYRMWRAPFSHTLLTSDERGFQTTVVASMYKRAGWEEGHAAFVNFDLLASSEAADVCAGACFVGDWNQITASFAWGERDALLANETLAAAGFGATIVQQPNEWAFERRPWQPGSGDADVFWAIEHLARAGDVWDGTSTRALSAP